MEGVGIPAVAITAALSVIGTLGVTYFGHWLSLSKDRELRREELDRHARYLAIRIVCKLDPFISECCDITYDDGLPDQDGVMRPGVGAPTLSFPDDVDWKSIKPDLMYRILGFPNELEIARQSIEFVGSEIAGPPDYSDFFEERIVQYGQLGLAALELGNEIRGTYGIPKRNYHNWNPQSVLEKAIAKAKKEREETQATSVKLMEEMFEKNPTMVN